MAEMHLVASMSSWVQSPVTHTDTHKGKTQKVHDMTTITRFQLPRTKRVKNKNNRITNC
jgi:hypothetical protein